MTASSSPINSIESGSEANTSASGTDATRIQAKRQGAEDAALSEQEASSENRKLAQHMHSILEDSRQEAEALRHKLTLTYWIVVTLSVLMFLVGLALISAPLGSLIGENGIRLEPFAALEKKMEMFWRAYEQLRSFFN
jgi:hypothetical protein